MPGKKRKARQLFDLGEELMASDEAAAIECFEKAIGHFPVYWEAHYNIGLLHKYTGEWEQSFFHNEKAVAICPADEAANWNLAIAATALEKWDTAREVWTRQNIPIPDGEGPINHDFGITPVRIDPDGNGEVVWARRICPVRARIENIPMRESGYSFGDVVLHDGAGTGEREYNGRIYPVFNVLQRMEKSGFQTFVFEMPWSTSRDVEAKLDELFAEDGMVEDWTESVRLLCRQCSLGTIHEQCDTELESEPPEKRRIAIALKDEAELQRIESAAFSGIVRVE